MKKSLFIVLVLGIHVVTYSQFVMTLGGGERGNSTDRPGSIGRDAVSRDAPTGGNGLSVTNGAQNQNGSTGSKGSTSIAGLFGASIINGSLTSNNSDVSKTTKNAITTIQNNLSQLQQTKGILLGSQLTILFQNPAEILGSVLLAIKGDDWTSTIGTMKNINTLQKQSIEQTIQDTILELETSAPFTGKAEEIKFWKKFDDSIK